MHRQPATGQLHGDRRRHGGFADAALAHQHHEAVAVGGNVVNQLRQARRIASSTGSSAAATSERDSVSPSKLTQGVEAPPD